MYLNGDWISCTLLQLLENQECCHEKMSLDVHAFFKASMAVLADYYHHNS